MQKQIKILVTGRYETDYNRTTVLLQGLRELQEVRLIELPLPIESRIDRKKVAMASEGMDFVFLPSFRHADVNDIRKSTRVPLAFDPLVSRYMTKIFDLQNIRPYSLRAIKNWFKDYGAFKNVDLLFADTEEHRDYYHDKFNVPREKIHVLPVGVNVEHYKPIQQLAHASFRIGFYGSFLPLQGVDKIVQVANLLRQEKRVTFEIAGDGFQFDAIKQLAKNELRLENVNFMGRIPQEDLANVIAGFDLCLGIFGEGIKADSVVPNKLFHYASMGKCIISKNTKPVSRIFENETNILLSSNNPQDIANKIRWAMENPLKMNEIGRNSRQLVLNHYSQKHIATIFVAALRSYQA